MIVKGRVIFERTLLSRKKSHNLAWSCAISNIFYCAQRHSQLTVLLYFTSSWNKMLFRNQGIIIGITKPPPKEGAWSALFSNLFQSGVDSFVVKRSECPLLEEVTWTRLPFPIDKLYGFWVNIQRVQML